MLAPMIEAWEAWLLVVGLAIGGATTAVLLVRLPRREDDVDPRERRTEAAWIAGTIDRYGGVAPVSLVEEVLDLHQAYLQLQRPPTTPPAAPDQVPWPASPPVPGYPPTTSYPPTAGYPPTTSYPPSTPMPGYPPAPPLGNGPPTTPPARSR
jgi:hypothetical protein